MQTPRPFLLALVFTVGCATDPTAGLTPVARTMEVTAYCPCKQCCGWKRTWWGKPVHANGPHAGTRKKIGVTASGEKARHGTVAAPASVPFGTIIDVPGYGRATVADRGSAIQGDHLDVFFKSHREALAWGRQNLTVVMWLSPAAIEAE